MICGFAENGQGMTDLPYEAKGCTVGVVFPGDGLIFFKNRDLAYEYIEHRTLVFESTPDTYALRGVNLQTKELEGVSIGVNRHLVCVANTHIRSTPDVAYDVLCEELMRNVRTREDATRVAEEFVRRQKVQGGRILVASPEWACLIEVYENMLEIEDVSDRRAITNTFSMIAAEGVRSLVSGQCPGGRLKVANDLLKDVRNLGDVKSLLRSHVPEKGGDTVCRHGANSATESSHIIQVRGGCATWWSLTGRPCENDYHAVQLF